MSALRRALWIKLVVTSATVAALVLAAFVPACGPGREAPPEPRGSAPWNVLVLVPDTVRADHLSINGYPRETTPRIDELARDGLNFSRSVTVAPRTWQSFSSILTGLYPPNHGVRFIYDEPIAEGTPIIASVLAAHGFATAAFDTIPFVRGMTGGRGFDHYAVARAGTPAGATPDETAADQVVEWVGSHGAEQPWFAFVRMSGGHWPYTNGEWAHVYHPCDDCSHAFNLGRVGVQRGQGNQGFVLSDEEAHRRLIWQVDSDEKSRAHRIAHYDSELRAVDEVIGGLLDRLDEAGQLTRTIVVVTSDHGESFGENGYLQHGPRVDHPVMRVPLIVWLPPGHPDREAPGERSDLARVIDVFPTVLDALDIAAPAGLDGRSLLGSPHDPADAMRVAYGESGRSFMGTDPERRLPGVRGKQRMLRTRDWKLVLKPGAERDITLLYDLREDPAERVDVSVQHPERVAALRARLDAIDPATESNDEARPLSSEEIERLKALGYMQ